jgi:hypothetical protein
MSFCISSLEGGSVSISRSTDASGIIASSSGSFWLRTSTKQLSGKKAQVNMAIKDKDNNTLTTEREQDLRWKEHFQEVLNQKDPDELAIIPEASRNANFFSRI